MYATQRTICRGGWSDDVYSYVVLVHSRLAYAWLLRYPAVLVADSFSAHLLTDLAADDSPHATWSGGRHWRLDMVRDIQRPVTSLCVDELDACLSWTPQQACASAPLTALACPRTCGICNESRPVVCRFRAELVGDWIAVTDPGQATSAAAVVVGSTTMTIRHSGGGDGVTETLHCVTWTGEQGRLPGEEMLVSEHEDGCLPRYTCMRYQRHAVDLLRLKLSQPRTWPLINAVDQPVDCRAFSYDDDDDQQQRADRPLRDRRFRLLYTRQPGPPTDCQLPLLPLRNYTLAFYNGSRCLNASVVRAAGGLGLLVSVDECDCAGTATAHTRQTMMHCVQSSRTTDGLALVTRAASTPSDVRCWFYVTANSELYWLPAADCGTAVVRRRLAGSTARLRYVAVLSPARRTDHVTTGTWPPRRHLPADLRSNDNDDDYWWSHSSNISDVPSLTRHRAGADTNSTPETEVGSEGKTTNVFVVFAAIVVFTLLQIPCTFCRVSA